MLQVQWCKLYRTLNSRGYLNYKRLLLRLHLSTGNNWGTDAEGTGMGHGPQEEFYGCADVRIKPGDTTDTENIDTDVTDTENTNGNATDTVDTNNNRPTTDSVDADADSVSPNDKWMPISNGKAVQRTDTKCTSANAYKGLSQIDEWCMNNCFAVLPFCPESHCQCFVKVSKEKEMEEEAKEEEQGTDDYNNSSVTSDNGNDDDVHKGTTQALDRNDDKLYYQTSVRLQTENNLEVEDDISKLGTTDAADVSDDILYDQTSSVGLHTTTQGDLLNSKSNPYNCFFKNNVLENPALDELCQGSCNTTTGTCSNDLCSCRQPCARYVAYREFTGDYRMDTFCQVTCQGGSTQCPWWVCTCADPAQQRPFCYGSGTLAGIKVFEEYCEMMCTDGSTELCPQYCICYH